MQTRYYPTFNACVYTTYRAEGLRGFYRGILPPLTTASFFKAVAFTAYTRTRNWIVDTRQPETTTAYTLSCFGAGFISGGAVGVLSVPLDLVKIQMQLARQANLAIPRSSWGIACHIVQQRGVRGLYYGTSLHLARESLGTAVYFGTYETAKCLILPHIPSAYSSLAHMMSGGLCGMACWLVIFPIDLVKSTMQKDVCSLQRPTIQEVLQSVYARSKSWRAFYHGVQVTLFRSVPIHALHFTVYEYALTWWNNHCITKVLSK